MPVVLWLVVLAMLAPLWIDLYFRTLMLCKGVGFFFRIRYGALRLGRLLLQKRLFTLKELPQVYQSILRTDYREIDRRIGLAIQEAQEELGLTGEDIRLIEAELAKGAQVKVYPAKAEDNGTT